MERVVAVLAALVAGSHAFTSLYQQLLQQQQQQGYGGYGAFGGYGGYPQLGGGYYKPKKPHRLTCAESFHADGYVTDSISVSIREKADSGGGFGHPPVYGAGIPSFWNGNGAHGQYGSRGLEASLQLFSTTGGKVDVIVTEKGFVGSHCQLENFGKGLSTKQHGGYGGGYGAGYGTGYGATGLGFASPHQFSGRQGGYGAGSLLPDGVIADVVLAPDTTQFINLGLLKGFDSIQDMAGRGVIVCDETDVAYDGAAECVGQILSCCTLSYDFKDRTL